MIQVYANASLVYDSRLEGSSLLALQMTTALNKGGSLELTMHPGHSHYNSFVSFKTIVTVYKDNKLLFRGRALYPSDDFLNRRTITCEGEMCFLRDAVMRPYDYQDNPVNIFTAIINEYNSQVEAEKQFVIGTISVVDPNDYLRFYTETAELVSETVDKLIEREGGYITFTTNSNGDRVINWLAELNYRSTQTIEFGENLIDFNRSANTEIATRIIPYGAKNDETGERLTISSIMPGGIDYVEDTEAVALRGVITRPVFFDDVTIASNLKTKAEAYLAESKNIITSMQLTAADLADAGADIDKFLAGDLIHVISRPHSADSWMLLTELTEDLLNPANNTISLGLNTASLTGSDVIEDQKISSNLENVEKSIRADYMKDVAAAIEASTQTLTSLIEQKIDSITSTVTNEYVTNGELNSFVASQIQQLADEISFNFTKLQAMVDENDSSARQQFEVIKKYIRFDGGDIILGEAGNEITLRIENDRIQFLSNGAEVAYFTNRKLYVNDGEFINSLQLGKFAFVPRENGSLSFLKVVD